MLGRALPRCEGIADGLREVNLPGVLEGIRIRDFGRYIAGQFSATLLAGFGAEVIRIERLAHSRRRERIIK